MYMALYEVSWARGLRLQGKAFLTARTWRCVWWYVLIRKLSLSKMEPQKTGSRNGVASGPADVWSVANNLSIIGIAARRCAKALWCAVREDPWGRGASCAGLAIDLPVVLQCHDIVSGPAELVSVSLSIQCHVPASDPETTYQAQPWSSDASPVYTPAGRALAYNTGHAPAAQAASELTV